MATKKSAAEAAAEAETEETAAEATEVTETTEAAETEATGTEPEAEIIRMIYIGPSLPGSRLRRNMILAGTEEQIRAWVKPMEERYPEIGFLLVSEEELPDAQKKARRKGNILHKYYEDMLAKTRVSRKGLN